MPPDALAGTSQHLGRHSRLSLSMPTQALHALAGILSSSFFTNALAGTPCPRRLSTPWQAFFSSFFIICGHLNIMQALSCLGRHYISIFSINTLDKHLMSSQALSTPRQAHNDGTFSVRQLTLTVPWQTLWFSTLWQASKSLLTTPKSLSYLSAPPWHPLIFQAYIYRLQYQIGACTFFTVLHSCARFNEELLWMLIFSWPWIRWTILADELVLIKTIFDVGLNVCDHWWVCKLLHVNNHLFCRDVSSKCNATICIPNDCVKNNNG